jgi:hypothetical protein
LLWPFADQPGEYFLCLDDDVLIYPNQLALLLRRLIEEPATPHGIAGKLNRRYRVGVESEVDDLYLAYAVTREHIETYRSYLEEMAADFGIDAETVEFWADDVVISRTGPGRARIHKVGYVHQCPTATSPGTAIYREAGSRRKRLEIASAVESIRSRSTASPIRDMQANLPEA